MCTFYILPAGTMINMYEEYWLLLMKLSVDYQSCNENIFIICYYYFIIIIMIIYSYIYIYSIYLNWVICIVQVCTVVIWDDKYAYLKR